MAAPNFNVTIVYESIEAGKRAKRFSDQFITEVGPDGTFKLNLWNFGVLGIPMVRNAAASAAAVSDVVIFSMSGTVPLPKRAVEWIEMWTWLIDRRKPAVVALFGTRHRECAPIRAYLRRSAVSKKLDFFPIMPRIAPDPEWNRNFFNRQRQERVRSGEPDCRNPRAPLQGPQKVRLDGVTGARPGLHGLDT